MCECAPPPPGSTLTLRLVQTGNKYDDCRLILVHKQEGKAEQEVLLGETFVWMDRFDAEARIIIKTARAFGFKLEAEANLPKYIRALMK